MTYPKRLGHFLRATMANKKKPRRWQDEPLPKLELIQLDAFKEAAEAYEVLQNPEKRKTGLIANFIAQIFMIFPKSLEILLILCI